MCVELNQEKLVTVYAAGILQPDGTAALTLVGTAASADVSKNARLTTKQESMV